MGHLPMVQAIRERVDEVVDPAVVYAAIDGVGLWLGPMFQVHSWLQETPHLAASVAWSDAFEREMSAG
eukprot:2516162-Amphidinium_carterae.1